MTALVVDLDSGYDSVHALKCDLQRFLMNQPVSAMGTAIHYQVKKYFQRHLVTGGFIAMGFGFMLLTAVVLGMAYVQVKAASKREEAVRRLAESSAEKFENSFRYFEELLILSHPHHQGDQDSFAEVLRNLCEVIEQDTHVDPELRARLLASLGRLHHGLGHYQVAAPLLLSRGHTLNERRASIGVYGPVLGMMTPESGNQGEEPAPSMIEMGDPSAKEHDPKDNGALNETQATDEGPDPEGN